MKVLSLFDGISCFRHALGDIPNLEYTASEIDKNAIKISAKNYPTIIRLGDVKDLSGARLVDLLVGGSPCSDLSVAKTNRKGLEGSRSKLFWEYVRIWKEVKPKWFILENVASMSEKDKSIITATMGVEPIMINASLVSAQNRKRLFWTNIPIKGLPADRGIMLKDILQKDEEVDKSCYTKDKFTKAKAGSYRIGRVELRRLDKDGKRHDGDKNYPLVKLITTTDATKSNTLTSLTEHNLIISDKAIRKLTPIECERLMGLPDNYTAGVSKTARYKAVGNAFHVEIMKWIVSFIP
jgi:DNA-cytosine methyltransferase